MDHASKLYQVTSSVVQYSAKMEDLIGAYSVFFDLPYQIAWRRYNHRKFWNVIIHVVTAWLSTKLLLSMAGILFPSIVNVFLIMTNIAICLLQDIKLGAIYSLLYTLVAYLGLNMGSSFVQVFVMLVLVLGFQIAVGHFLIENEQPVILEREGDAVFITFSIMNDLFLAPFHFSVLVLMRANLLPDLQWKSDIQLKKLMEQLSGKKSP